MEFKVKLVSVQDVKDFVNAAVIVDGSIDVSHNRYTVDGMSFLGLLSLDLSHPLNVKIVGDEASAEKFKKAVSQFLI